MGTGVLALALATVPAFKPVGAVLWLANIAIFAALALAYLATWIVHAKAARAVLLHPVGSMFLGCIPMALATIVNGTLVFGLDLFGAAALQWASMLFLVDVAMAVPLGVLVPFLMFTRQAHSIEQMTAVWLLPVVPAEVAGVTAGLLASHLPQSADQLGALMLGYGLWALSVPMAFAILVLLFLRLVLHKLPPADMAASSWLALGPLGTGALGLLTLGGCAAPICAATSLSPLGPVIAGASVLGALLMWALGLWWLCQAVLMTLSYLRTGLPFNLGWWGFTFPLGVYTLATARLAGIVPIAAIGVFANGLLLALALVWGLVMARTIGALVRGTLRATPSTNR